MTFQQPSGYSPPPRQNKPGQPDAAAPVPAPQNTPAAPQMRPPVQSAQPAASAPQWAPPPQAYAGPVVARPAKGALAVAALIVGILAFLTGLVPVVGLLLGLVGIVLGAVAARRARGFGVWAIVLSSLAVLTNVALFAIVILSSPGSGV